ncbi:MAG: esterase-like activity of phytase family protein [Planctomycetota bacterium]|nr:esterase-like activity of phytase family protein [Planctomycetota bacterium]
MRPLLFLATCLGLAAPAAVGQWSVEHRGSVLLTDTAVDQHGVPFAVGGLSGITHAGGATWLCVMDNSDKVVILDVVQNDDGSIASAAIVGGLTLEESRDFEGIAHTGAASGSVLISDEGVPSVREFSLSDGRLLAVRPTPAVFDHIRPNRGFESLARRCESGDSWTANEEALTVDGPPSTPTNPTVVRLLRHDASAPDPVAAEQYAYWVEPMHGAFLPGQTGQSGLCDLVALPGGLLLALERSIALASPLFLSRIFLVDFAAASDVSAFPALDGAVFTPATKTLLWSGPATNLEGLALGPPLTPSVTGLLGIVDSGDPLSQNRLEGFALIGPPPGGCICTTSSFCATSQNSAGSGALIGSTGQASVSANTFTLTATGAVGGQFGLFYYGGGQAQVPFGDGLRCVSSGGVGTFRLGPPQTIDGAGGLERLVDFTQPPAGSGSGAIAAGSTWFFQLWFRDPGAGGTGFNLSDGLSATFCP